MVQIRMETLERGLFTADWHLSHKNILRHCNRPFESSEEMDNLLLEKLEEQIGDGDRVLFFLGDLSWRSNIIGPFSRILKRTGTRLIFTWGNHDNKYQQEILKLSCLHSVGDLIEVICPNQLPITLCHYPLRSWRGSSRGSLHLHGHCHGNIERTRNQLDVGVDMAYKLLGEYRPFTTEEVLAHI
jgi:calcineurin-like phosphoesterase family protein